MVGGVTPGKGGTKHEGIDVFNTVAVGDPEWVTGGRVFPVARGQLGQDYAFGSGNLYVGVLWDKVAAEFLRLVEPT